jgi:hypothetical protein
MINPLEVHEQRNYQDLGVYYWPSILQDAILKQAANQAENSINDSIIRSSNYSELRSSPYISCSDKSDDEFSIVDIEWPTTENEDHFLAEDIKEVNGIDCKSIFIAARMLLRSTGIMPETSSKVLSLFRTKSSASLPLHRDQENQPDFDPDEDFVRYILHLRGKRELSFSDNEQDVPAKLNLRPGDAYEIKPHFIYHGAEYDDFSLAMYIQTD